MINKLQSLKFNKEFFIFLLPLFFIFHGITEHSEAIPIRDAIFLFFEYCILILFLCLIFVFIFRSFRKAALLSFILISFHFFYGSLHDWVKESFGNMFFTKYSFILPAFFFVLIALIIYFKRTKRTFKRFIYYLNVLCILLIIIDCVNLAGKRVYQNKKLSTKFITCDTCKKPDIYLIITDGYAGRQALNDIFHFDNSDFEDSLRSRGFQIIENSLSNYRFTIYSMSSMFSLEYLENFKGNESEAEINKLLSKINENVFIRFLLSLGYDIKNFSIFKVAGQFPSDGTNIFLRGVNIITNQTFLSRIKKDLGYHLVTTFKIKSEIDKFKKKVDLDSINAAMRDHYVMESLLKEAKRKVQRPRFIYTHLMMPHGPSYFDKDGNPPKKSLPDRQQYVEYIQYTNKKILPLIDRILKTTADPPVILFMSDHGYRDSVTNLNNYAFMNMNAIYYPDKQYNGFYKGMSNVNQFRVLLNSKFNQKLSILKDSVISFRN